MACEEPLSRIRLVEMIRIVGFCWMALAMIFWVSIFRKVQPGGRAKHFQCFGVPRPGGILRSYVEAKSVTLAVCIEPRLVLLASSVSAVRNSPISGIGLR